MSQRAELENQIAILDLLLVIEAGHFADHEHRCSAIDNGYARLAETRKLLDAWYATPCEKLPWVAALSQPDPPE
jgi:hypothetical protein